MPCLFPGVRWPTPCYRDGTVVIVGDFYHGKVYNGAVVAFGENAELLAASLHKELQDLPQIPCGKCIRCKIRSRRDMAVRLHKESEFYPKTTLFWTFTYDDPHVPWGSVALPSEITGELTLGRAHSLRASDMRTFFKDLRSWYDYWYPKETGVDYVPLLRQYHCGEYGPTTKRPHYHAITYGIDPSFLGSLGRVVPYNRRLGLFESEVVSEKWGKGRVVFGEASFDGMQYVAGYVVKKKIPRDLDAEAEAFWTARNMECRTVRACNGSEYTEFQETHTFRRGKEVPYRPPCMIEPEFAHGSNRPGIAHEWYVAHRDELYPLDEMHIPGKNGLKTIKPVSYFDRLYDLDHRDPDDPDLPSAEILAIKKQRRDRASEAHEILLKQQNITEKQYRELEAHKAEPVASRIIKYRNDF